MARLHVLISGAGVAGNALAFWLAKQQHIVTVIEKHHCLRISGLQVDLRGHGIEVAKLMGLEQVIRAKCIPEQGMGLVDATGRRRAFFPVNNTGKGAQAVTSEFEIMRGDLCQILYEAAQAEGAKYRFGTGLEAFAEEDGIVAVSFSDGSTEEFNLLVGCDGQGSKVRRLLWGNCSPSRDQDDALFQLQEKIAYFTMADPIKEGEKYVGLGCAFPGPGKRAMGMRRHKDDRIQVYLMCKPPSGADSPFCKVQRGDLVAEKAAFAKMYRDCGWRAPEAVHALETAADDFYCQHTGVVKLKKWSRGCVALVGDAGYGCPPDGFGTSMALVGAYILGGEIGNACGMNTTNVAHAAGAQNFPKRNEEAVLNALRAYEEQFGPHMKRIVHGYAVKPGLWEKIPWTPFTVGLVNNAFGAASWLRLDKLAAKLTSDDRNTWELPVYG